MQGIDDWQLAGIIRKIMSSFFLSQRPETERYLISADNRGCWYEGLNRWVDHQLCGCNLPDRGPRKT